MTSAPSKLGILAKTIEMEYAFPGKLLKGWEVERIDAGTFRLHRSNGSSREITLDRHMVLEDRSVVMPTVDESGVMLFGEWSVIIGRGIDHDMHARRRGKTKNYILMGADGRIAAEISLGGVHEGQPVSLLDSHLLQIGEKIVPVLPKQRDVTLKVMDREMNGGKLAYINLHIPGFGDSRRNAPPGAFFRPTRAGEPAQFKEVVAGKLVTTALFQIAENGKSVQYKFRTGEMALADDKLAQALQAARDVALEAAIPPEEYHAYVEANDKLLENQKRWVRGRMSLSFGGQWFRPAGPEKSYDSSPQP